jgi:hypothetical protein
MTNIIFDPPRDDERRLPTRTIAHLLPLSKRITPW